MTATEAELTAQSTESGRPELRLALGMRGGVSLAVWIGGACVEVDHLRLCKEQGGVPFWSDVLEMSGYSGVVVDVMAGTSAGGLNAVLFAASQQYGFRFDALRGVWMEVANLQDLIRRADDPASSSLLDGDGYFLAKIREQLGQLVETSVEHRQAPRVRPSIDVQLTTTFVTPITRPAPSPSDEQLYTSRSAGVFRFRHLEDCPWLSDDFPDGGSASKEQLQSIVDRLSLAARSTASYPGAFEAAVVRSTRCASFSAADEARETSGALVDMRYVFADRRGGVPRDDQAASVPQPDDFIVADGGVLDNIPLGKALRAIADATADRPTRRYLVYLQPGGPRANTATRAAKTTRSPDARRSAVSVVRGAVQAIYAPETIAGDIAELERHNKDVERARLMRLVTLGGIKDREALIVWAGAARDSYRVQRASADAALIDTLLDDPIAALGDDPFPLAVGTTCVAEENWRSPLVGWTLEERGALENDITEQFLQRFENAWPLTNVFEVGTQPLLRVTRLLIEWARYLERNGVQVGRQKVRLYRILRFTRLAIDRPRRLAWVVRTALRDTSDETKAWALSAATAVNRLVLVSAETSEKIVHALHDGEDMEALRDYVNATNQGLDEMGSDVVKAGSSDLRVSIVRLLAKTAEEARAVIDDEFGGIDDDTMMSTDERGAHMLHRALAGQEIDEAALAALEIVCFPEFTAGRAGERPVEFVRLAATNRTPIGRYFKTLHAASVADATSEESTKLGDDYIDVKEKLAGNELMNFAAFIKEEWRANDWMWGRLDAVTTLVDLLITRDTLAEWVTRVGGNTDPSTWLQDLVTSVGACDDAHKNDWSRWMTDLWSRYAKQIGKAIDAVKAGHELHPADLQAVRDVLIARRQLEIVIEELWRAQPGATWPSSEDLLERLCTHNIGTQTLTEPPDLTTAELFARLSDAAADTIVWNARAFRHPNNPEKRDTVDQGVERFAEVLKAVGSKVAYLVLAPPGERGLAGFAWQNPVWALLALVTAGLGFAAWSFLSDWKVALGGAIAMLLIAVPLIAGWIVLGSLVRTRRKRSRARAARSRADEGARRHSQCGVAVRDR